MIKKMGKHGTIMIQFPNISPEIFSVSLGGFEFALRWYALSYIVGILLSWRIMVAASVRPHLWPDQTPPMSHRQIEDFMTYAVIGIIVGGRLGFVLFYQPAYYAENPMDIIKVWQGGMAFHGGLAGVILAAYLYFKTQNVPIGRGADMVALSVPLGLMLGRLANFINAELWGRPTDLPWGVIFPGQAAQTCGDVVGLCARHPSQLYQATLEGLVLALLLAYLAFRRQALKKTGLITGVFFIGYGIARSFVELFRQPDAQFQSVDNPIGYAVQFSGIGLTMGQLLSIPMIVLGLALVIRAKNK